MQDQSGGVLPRNGLAEQIAAGVTTGSREGGAPVEADKLTNIRRPRESGISMNFEPTMRNTDTCRRVWPGRAIRRRKS